MRDRLKQHAKRVIDILADRMYDKGMIAINEARANATFQNHTNNLRSSFGVAVALNGRIIRSNFELHGNGSLGDGGEGLAKAKRLIGERAGQYRDQLLLVLVAAEQYALYVESKGRAVLTFVSYDLKKNLKKII